MKAIYCGKAIQMNFAIWINVLNSNSLLYWKHFGWCTILSSLVTRK